MRNHAGRFTTFALLAASLALLSAGPAESQSYEPADVALLPPYCKHAQLFRDKVPGGNDPAEIKRWYTVLGGTFHHMHHYCWALMAANKAITAGSKQRRNSLFDVAIRDIDYVLQRAPRDFVLLPEILTKKGQNLIKLGNLAQGLLVLQQAVEVKPDYWPPYATAADALKETGQSAKAREWLEKGLAAAPDTPALQRRLAELGGDKGKRAVPPKPAEKAAPSPGSAKTGSGAEPVQDAETSAPK
jgi:tetratricopeptide (TPR) repeat protein